MGHSGTQWDTYRWPAATDGLVLVNSRRVPRHHNSFQPRSPRSKSLRYISAAIPTHPQVHRQFFLEGWRPTTYSETGVSFRAWPPASLGVCNVLCLLSTHDIATQLSIELIGKGRNGLRCPLTRSFHCDQTKLE